MEVFCNIYGSLLILGCTMLHIVIWFMSLLYAGISCQAQGLGPTCKSVTGSNRTIMPSQTTSAFLTVPNTLRVKEDVSWITMYAKLLTPNPIAAAVKYSSCAQHGSASDPSYLNLNFVLPRQTYNPRRLSSKAFSGSHAKYAFRDRRMQLICCSPAKKYN